MTLVENFPFFEKKLFRPQSFFKKRSPNPDVKSALDRVVHHLSGEHSGDLERYFTKAACPPMPQKPCSSFLPGLLLGPFP